MRALPLGDMTVIGEVPAKLLKACAVIADTLHPEFARQPWIAPDKSKESCVLCSLAVRDFLRAIGFVNAHARPVIAYMIAFKGEQQLHSLGIGVPDILVIDDGRWNGHLVVWVPGSRVLIDTTLYRMIRPQWSDLSPMLAIGCPKQPRLHQLAVLRNAKDDYEFELTYLDNPINSSWRNGPDARDRWKRIAVVEAMRAKFGAWHGKA